MKAHFAKLTPAGLSFYLFCVLMGPEYAAANIWSGVGFFLHPSLPHPEWGTHWGPMAIYCYLGCYVPVKTGFVVVKILRRIAEICSIFVSGASWPGQGQAVLPREVGVSEEDRRDPECKKV